MPRFEKWLQSIAPTAAVDRVAHKSLALRLRAVTHYLEASIGGDDEADAIHQLRIWTRRTAAALRLFAPALPVGPTRKLNKTLRKLRRTAGAVRDCDVHLAHLESGSQKAPRKLAKLLKRQRYQARKKLRALRRRQFKKDRLDGKAAAVLDAIAWPKRHSSREAPHFAPWCRQQLAALAEEFFQQAASDPADDRQLHELRKEGKRLRYALELAPSAIAPRVHQRLYEELSQMQDRLGQVCDHLVAVERIREWLRDADKSKQRRQLEELLAGEEQRLETSRRQFQRWWTAARRARWRERWQAIERSGP